MISFFFLFFFFFQAEDGIRDFHVTGVQTCALPIFGNPSPVSATDTNQITTSANLGITKIGRASCRERGVDLGGRRIIKKKKKKKRKEREMNRKNKKNKRDRMKKNNRE